MTKGYELERGDKVGGHNRREKKGERGQTWQEDASFVFLSLLHVAVIMLAAIVSWLL